MWSLFFLKAYYYYKITNRIGYSEVDQIIVYPYPCSLLDKDTDISWMLKLICICDRFEYENESEWRLSGPFSPLFLGQTFVSVNRELPNNNSLSAMPISNISASFLELYAGYTLSFSFIIYQYHQLSSFFIFLTKSLT